MRIFALILSFSVSSCGSKNIYDCDGGLAGSRCSALTKEEDARVALDDGDLETAVTLLSELVTADPTNYQRYPLLAAAYAGRAGFDILNIATANFGGNSSLIQTMGAFLPTPVSRGSLYDQSLSDMKLANATLTGIPEELRSATSSDKYATSAVMQLTLYQSAYGVMVLNKFTYSSTDYDPSLLSSMTAEDAASVLTAFAAAGAASGGSMATAVNSALAAIQAQPGATDQEKLAAWSQAAR